MKCTKFISPKTLTKTFTKQENIITKETPSFGWMGFEVMEMDDLQGLQSLISGLESYEALSYAVPSVDLESGKLKTKGWEDVEHGIISRTKDCFHYAPGPGFLFIDVDDGMKVSETISNLTKLYKGFQDVTFLYATSSSNGINGKHSYHLYCTVNDSSLTKQAMDDLFDMAFLQGFGHCIINKAGSCLQRTFFDKSVYDVSRMDFAAGPVCIGFPQPERVVELINWDGENEVELDLRALITSLTATERRKIEGVKAKEKQKVVPEMEKVRHKISKSRGIAVEDYNLALDGGILYSDYVLPDGTKVSDLMEETEDRAICHPFLGGYEDKTKLYPNAKRGVVIHSFKGGSQTWVLEHGNPNEKVERLPEHYHTEYLMKLVQGTYKERGIPVPETTMRDMVSLYLHMLAEGHKGCYNIDLQTSAGKTQAILHLAWFISKYHTDKSICIAFQQRKDIDEAYEFLKSKGVDVAFSYSNSGDNKPTPMTELKDYQVVLHTHYKIRANDYDSVFYNYKGKKRDLLFFDEAYYGTISVEAELCDAVAYLEKAIMIEESKGLGLPLGWMKDTQKQLKRANILVGEKYCFGHRIVNIRNLGGRFTDTAWRIKGDDKLSSFLSGMFLIASSEENHMRIEGSAGSSGNAMLMYKVNYSNKLNKIVNTDATREVRKVHDLSPQRMSVYPIRKKVHKPQIVYYVKGMSDAKGAMDATVGEKNERLWEAKEQVVREWIKEVGSETPGVVQSMHLPALEGTMTIPYGKHKQTNEFSDCDSIIVMHQFRKPRQAYKNECLGEAMGLKVVTGNDIHNAEIGSMADNTVQAMGRGACRRDEEQPTLVFINSEELLDAIKSCFVNYSFREYSTEAWDGYLDLCRAEDLAKEARRDKKYATMIESNWAKNFNRTLNRKSLRDNNGSLLVKYMLEKAEGIAKGPGKWIRENVEEGQQSPKQNLTHTMGNKLGELLNNGGQGFAVV